MIFKSIHLENFRNYKGPEELSFADTGDKNITIIQGNNDTGKGPGDFPANHCVCRNSGGRY